MRTSTRRISTPHTAPAANRGTVLIVTMWIVLVLAGLVLALARSMRVEAICSANDTSILQADAVEQGAIQYVLSRVDSLGGQAPVDEETPCEAVRVGNGSGAGAFWILRPNYDDSRTYNFGITDEAGKINLNIASKDVLALLPDMTDELASCIVDWRDGGTEISPGGAKSEYYMTLPDPYQCKSGPLETVEELFLVKGATREILFGEDTNRNGMLDPNEDDGDLAEPLDNRDGNLDYGIYPFVTVYSQQPATTGGGAAGGASGGGATGGNNAGGAAGGGAGGAGTGGAGAGGSGAGGGSTGSGTGSGTGTATATATITRGLINVNTAPRQVLACLPNLTDSDVSALIAARTQSGVDLTTPVWVSQTLPADKLAGISSLITVKTYRFSADIVAVSGDGRAFRRCRIVVDATNSPLKIIYRQDLTALGWPLAPDILTRLRSGVSLDQIAPGQGSVREVLP